MLTLVKGSCRRGLVSGFTYRILVTETVAGTILLHHKIAVTWEPHDSGTFRFPIAWAQEGQDSGASRRFQITVSEILKQARPANFTSEEGDEDKQRREEDVRHIHPHSEQPQRKNLYLPEWSAES